MKVSLIIDLLQFWNLKMMENLLWQASTRLPSIFCAIYEFLCRIDWPKEYNIFIVLQWQQVQKSYPINLSFPSKQSPGKKIRTPSSTTNSTKTSSKILLTSPWLPNSFTSTATTKVLLVLP